MEYKRILTIQDISCVGQCSGAVAVPVLNACGHETCLLPTAVLSTHTGGFDRPAVRQLGRFIPEAFEHWFREGIRFDAIYTGYVGNTEGVRYILEGYEALLVPGGLLIVDPAMADHGRMYRGLDDAYGSAMGALCRRADIVLPNGTEAAMLTGRGVPETVDGALAEELLKALPQRGVVLTGVESRRGETGAMCRWENGLYASSTPKVDGVYSGTGDLFAACFTGALMRGTGIEKATDIACRITYQCVRATRERPAHRYGIRFEEQLPELMRILNLI